MKKLNFDSNLVRMCNIIDARINEMSFFQLLRNEGPLYKGIYYLYHKGELVYIGKSSSQSLRNRLNDHVIRIDEAEGIELIELTYKFVPYDSKWISTIEDMLIVHHKPKWNNGSGFGYRGHNTIDNFNNNRTKIRPWDEWYPRKGTIINKLKFRRVA